MLFSSRVSSVLALGACIAVMPNLVVAEVDCIAPCDGDVCTYTAQVDLHASELGYFTFKECADITNPTIGMQVGKTYRFVQEDRSNYYHPLGFAYFPDGAHDDQDELEPGIVPPGSSSGCGADMSCPAPIYYQNGVSLGKYNNIPTTNSSEIDTGLQISQITTGEDDFGLDFYEPLFFHPLGDWLGYGKFEIVLRFDVDDYDKDMFYFCHIHQFMSGRIKLLDENNEEINKVDEPPLGYEYDTVSEFDKQCGTFNVSDYQLPHGQCPARFVCDVADEPGLNEYSECFDAINCAMMVGMTTDATSEVGLFIHQMIPHHQNAVNQAKTLLKTGFSSNCDVLSDNEDPNCIMEGILREIINGQNSQIQVMRGVLESLEEPQYADCEVLVFGEAQRGEAQDGSSGDSSSPMTMTPQGAGILSAALLLSFGLLLV